MTRLAIAASIIAGLSVVPVVSPAEACSYSQAPELVGHASAEFFTRRMAPQATFVDVAVAEDTRPAFGAAKGWPVPSTTFRVVYRLKGLSPDRFSLFVGALPQGERVPEAAHFVDEEGRVSPFPYPRETSLDAPYIGNSCDPGMLRVRPGQAYVIFRETDGRLLGPVPMHDGRNEEALPIIPVTLDEFVGWRHAAEAATAGRAQDLPAKSPASDLIAVRFKSGLSAKDAERWVQAASVRPVAVSVARGKVIEETRVPLNHAGAGLIAHALQPPPTDRPRYLRSLSAQFLDETDESLELNVALQQNAELLFQSTAVEPDPSAPAQIVAMEVTGTVEALARLARHPQVAEVQRGYVARGRTGANPLVPRAAPIKPYTGTDRRETGPSLRARLRAFAEGRPMPEARFVPPATTPDPFSSTGCIRIGEAEALALNLPLFARLKQFSLYAPASSDCSRTPETLTCRVPAGSAVRLDAGTAIGGFRVGPQRALFELREKSIICRRASD